MSAVPVTVVGLYTTDNGQSGNITISGMMSRSDLEVGGGPIVPPDAPGKPPGTPIHPIWGPPGFNPPGEGMPPGIWGGPILPKPPVDPPVDPTPPPAGVAVKPPPESGGWGYVSTWGWGYFPGPGESGPKR